MSTIIIAQENNVQENTSAAPAHVFENIFRLRHEIFLERLQWDIETRDGMERDNFDDLEPYHIAVQNPQGGIDGCWRALPTMGSYMLKDVFPELLQGEVAPTEANVWEISRFAVRKGSANALKGYMSGITIQMVRSFYEFAQKKGIHYYVTVTTVACERMLRQLGVDCWRMGDGKALQIGIERSVALWIKVDQSLNINPH